MRRNVRRLNREVNDGQPNNKHVVVTNAQNDPNRVVEIVVPKNTDLRDKSKAAKPGQKKTRSRRAANLAGKSAPVSGGGPCLVKSTNTLSH